MRHSLLWTTFALVVLTGLLHLIASIFYLYWNSVWFDGLMHLLGGLVVGLMWLWLWYASGLFGKGQPSSREAFISALIAAMVVGIGWELFEYVYGIAAPIGGNYAVDTFHDLLFDFLGGVLAGIVGRMKSFYV